MNSVLATGEKNTKDKGTSKDKAAGKTQVLEWYRRKYPVSSKSFVLKLKELLVFHG